MSECTERAVTTSARRIAGVVDIGLQQASLRGYSEVLRYIGNTVGATACVVWQLSPGANLQSTPPEGRLFVQAQWLDRDPQWSMYDLALSTSVGQAVLSGRVVHSGDLERDASFISDESFFHPLGARSLYAVPLRLNGSPESSHPDGVLAVYSNDPGQLDADRLEFLRLAASLLPGLYRSIRDRVGYHLLMKIAGVFRGCTTGTDAISESLANGAITEIARLVTDTFKCLEVSIILENRLTRAGVYRVVVTTWPEKGQCCKFANVGVADGTCLSLRRRSARQIDQQ
jgi:hypothetical protein